MIPTTAHTAEAIAYWADLNPRPVTFTAPDDPPGCMPCPALVTDSTDRDGSNVVRVAWKPDEIDLAHLARGGTIWLSCWGGLPPHMLEVAPPPDTGIRNVVGPDEGVPRDGTEGYEL